MIDHIHPNAGAGINMYSEKVISCKYKWILQHNFKKTIYTEFYFYISIGGAHGGVFSSLIRYLIVFDAYNGDLIPISLLKRKHLNCIKANLKMKEYWYLLVFPEQ
jgi:hypothetical protein